MFETFFFGPPSRKLFGCHHPPRAGRNHPHGVIVCHAVGHEYALCSRALRQLADLLARAGFHALRFDFSGSGDSNGDWEENSVPRWLGDISLAIEELKRRTNLEKVCLMGCRLGATLALMAAATRDDIESLILWSPVWSGREFCKQLRAWHRDVVRRSHVIAATNGAPENGAELLGFVFPYNTMADLERLDVSDLELKSARHVLVMEEDRETRNQEKKLRSGGAVVDRRLTPTAMNWKWVEILTGVLVPRQTLEAMVSWLSETAA
jgi:uncharacterized protein